MSNLNQSILDVVKDEKFAKKISELKTPEEVQAAFKEKGVNITLDEVNALGAVIAKMQEKQTTELSDKDIEDVAGGIGNSFRSIFRNELKLYQSSDKEGKDKKALEKDANGKYVGLNADQFQTIEGGDLTGVGIATGVGVGLIAAAGIGKLGYDAFKWAKNKRGNNNPTR